MDADSRDPRGAGVGIVVNLVFPPRLAHTDAESAIRGLADRLAASLESAGDDIEPLIETSDRLPEDIGYWLGEVRQLTHSIPDVGGSLLRAEESRRLNLRAIGTPDVGPDLRSGLEVLEHSAIAVRSMLRSIEEAGLSRREHGDADDFREDLRLIAASELFQLAAAFRAFSVLLHAEAQRSQALPEDDIVDR